MQNETREHFNRYLDQLAHLNGVDKATQKFNVSPSVQQTLENHIQESSAFLSRINMVGVREQEGEKLRLGVGSPIASTTDTNIKERQTFDPIYLDGQRYRAEKTNFDTHIKYELLDMWAGFQDFQARIRNTTVKRQALDRIMIGFNGIHRAATSNRDTNQLLEDINIGWLQQYRKHAPERVLKESQRGGPILIRENGDYANLDALVFDAVNTLIDPWYQEDTELVVICGRKLLQDKYFPIINQNHRPTDTLAVDVITSQKRIGNLPAVRVPQFPNNSLLITRLDNLSLYWQIGGRRRTIVDNAKRDQIEIYESTNDAYVIEDFGAGCLIDNIDEGKPDANEA